MARDDMGPIRPQAEATAQDPLRTPKETAKRLRVEPQTLAKWRQASEKAKARQYARPRPHLRFRRIGGHIFYLESDIQAFIDAVASDAPKPAPPKQKRRPRARKAA